MLSLISFKVLASSFHSGPLSTALPAFLIASALAFHASICLLMVAASSLLAVCNFSCNMLILSPISFKVVASSFQSGLLSSAALPAFSIASAFSCQPAICWLMVAASSTLAVCSFLRSISILSLIAFKVVAFASNFGASTFGVVALPPVGLGLPGGFAYFFCVSAKSILGAAFGFVTFTATSTFLLPSPKMFFSHSHASLHFSTSHAKALAKPFIMAVASGLIASQTLSTIFRKLSQLLYAYMIAATNAPMAVITMPIGLAVSTKLSTFCTAVHAAVATDTTFCAAATAKAAPLFLTIATVEAKKALADAYSVTDRVLMPATKVVTPASAVVACAAIVTKGSAPFTIAPNSSFISPSVFTNCCCFPLSVLANSAFISPTLFCITWASIAAFSCSVPYLITLASASEKLIPTRFSASTWPIIALPIKLPICTASPVVADSPFCCANKLFIAGSRVSKLSFSFKKVATCCAPLSCTSSPITPISCCALASSLILCISLSVAPIRCRIMVDSFVSAISCTA